MPTLNSLFRQTNQGFEIIVVDDNSSDNTFGLLKPFIEKKQLKYFKHETNLERAVARNTGLDNENGLVCLPEDVDSLYLKMAQMMDSPENWNEMGKKGSDLVHKLFKKETQMPILERIFEKSLKESNL